MLQHIGGQWGTTQTSTVVFIAMHQPSDGRYSAHPKEGPGSGIQIQIQSFPEAQLCLFSRRNTRTQEAQGALAHLLLSAFWEPAHPGGGTPALCALPGSPRPLLQLLQPRTPRAAAASSPANPSSLFPALCTPGWRPVGGRRG